MGIERNTIFNKIEKKFLVEMDKTETFSRGITEFANRYQDSLGIRITESQKMAENGRKGQKMAEKGRKWQIE